MASLDLKQWFNVVRIAVLMSVLAFLFELLLLVPLFTSWTITVAGSMAAALVAGFVGARRARRVREGILHEKRVIPLRRGSAYVLSLGSERLVVDARLHEQLVVGEHYRVFGLSKHPTIVPMPPIVTQRGPYR